MGAELRRLPDGTDRKAKALRDGFWISGQFYQADLESRYLWRRLALGELHDELVEISHVAAQGDDLLPVYPSGPSDGWPSFEAKIRLTSGTDGEEVWAWFRDSKLSRSDRNRLLDEDNPFS